MLMGRRLHLRGLGPLQSLQARKSYEIVGLFLTHAHCVVNESKFNLPLIVYGLTLLGNLSNLTSSSKVNSLYLGSI